MIELVLLLKILKTIDEISSSTDDFLSLMQIEIDKVHFAWGQFSLN